MLFRIGTLSQVRLTSIQELLQSLHNVSVPGISVPANRERTGLFLEGASVDARICERAISFGS